MGAKRGSVLKFLFIALLVFVGSLLMTYLNFEHFPTKFQIPTTLLSPCNCSSTSSTADAEGFNSTNLKAGREVSACPPAQERITVVEKVVEKVIEKVVENPRPVFNQWFADGKAWHTRGMFPLCSMDVCFNFTRCENMEELLIYHYNSPSTPVRFFEGLETSPWYTADPDKACLFLVFSDNETTPWRVLPSTLPYWNHGMNHVIVTFADRWSLKNPPAETIEFASVLSSELHETTYRPGFDIAMPLPAKAHLEQLQNLKPSERKYFLTFRGLRYLGTKGEGIFRSDKSFRNLHNGNDVIVVTTCKQGTNDILRAKNPELGAGCDEDQELFEKHTFVDLMNSTFSLAPAGRSPSSYRFIEVISAGAIPVLIADNYVKPFDTLIQWHRCTLQFPTSEMDRILPALRSLSQQDVELRQKYCLFAYNEFLKSDATLLLSVVRSFKARFYGVFGKFAEMPPLPHFKRRLRRL